MQDLINSNTAPLLIAVASMTLWHFIVMLVAFIFRIKAIQDAKLPPDAGQDTSALAAQLPESANFKMDNYNHLFEQPTVFYAIALTIAIAGLADGVYVGLAWAFVALRVLHSANQMTVNHVMGRFTIFIVAWAVLGAMIIRSLFGLMA